MKTLLRLLLWSTALGLVLVVVWFGARPDPSEGGVPSGASPASLHAVEQPALDPSVVLVEAVESAELARVPAEFTGGGSIRLLGQDDADGSISLAWSGRGAGAQIVVDARRSSWTARFSAEQHELVEASVNATQWQVVEPASISPESPTCDVLLAPPRGRVVDVYGADSPERRLPEVNVEINPIEQPPKSGAVKVSRTRGADGRVQFVATTEDSQGRELSTWRLERACNPVLLPEQASGSTLRVSARGYAKQLVELPAAPGVTKVHLTPSRALVVELRGADPAAQVAVRLTEFGAGPPSRGPDSSLFTQHRFDDVRSDRVRVEITTSADDTQPGSVVSRDVVMAPTGDTHEVIELGKPPDAPQLATVQIEVVDLGAGAALARSKFGLLPIDTARGEVSVRAQRHWTPLSQFEAAPTGGRFTVKLEGVSHGVYLAVLAPIGVARRVEVVAGTANTIALEVSPLAKLIVWPTRASGGRAKSAEELGALFWRPAHEATGSSGAAAASGRPSTPAVSGEDIVLGLATAATFADGAWEVHAPAGTRIVLTFMGPRALGAEPLEFVMAPGVQEIVLEFENL